jgi:hypothetical protein
VANSPSQPKRRASDLAGNTPPDFTVDAGLGRRSLAALIVSAALLVTLFAYLMMMVWQRESVSNYLAARSRLLQPKPTDLVWTASPVLGPSSCATPEACYAEITPALQPEARDLEDFVLLPPQTVEAPRRVLLRLSIPVRAFGPLLDYTGWYGVALPSFFFAQVDIFVNGVHHATFHKSSDLATTLAKAEMEAGGATLRIDLLFRLHADATQLYEKIADAPVLLTTTGELRAYQRFVTMNRVGRGFWVSELTVIVLGTFVLILSLFIDSSADALTLALYLGFQAVSLSFDYNWLPFVDLSPIEGFSSHMASVFRLAFVLTIARRNRVRFGAWLLLGAVASALYGFVYAKEVELHAAEWRESYDNWRELVINIAGFLSCLVALSGPGARRFAWRTSAVACALVACAVGLVDGVVGAFPDLGIFAAFNSVLNVSRAASLYLLATSAFISISTLEQRVRALSLTMAKSKVIEKELELANAVQKAFMGVPKLPRAFGLAFHQEAASVSGDAYFVNWDQDEERLTLLVTDVTGHGIHSALKSSACQVIAKTIWSDPTVGHLVRWRSRFLHFEQQLTRFLSENRDAPDVAAILGLELDRRSGTLELYRVNFTFPILIERSPDAPETWRVRLLTIPNRQLTPMPLPPDALVIVLSDGFLGTSRDALRLVRHLQRAVADRPRPPTPDEVRDLVLGWHDGVSEKVNDDRTLMAFQWTPHVEDAERGLDASA